MKRVIFPVLTCVASILLLLGCNKKEESKAPPPLPLTVKLVHSPEVRAYLGSLRDSFLAQRPTLANGVEIKLDLISELGISAAKRISSGELKTDAWLVPSSGLIDYVNRTRVNLGPGQTQCRPLFGTPVVIAIKPDHEVLLGADAQRRFSWTRLMRNASAGREGAGGFQLTLSHAQPRSSTTGLASLVQLSYLAAGESRIDIHALKQPEFVQRLKSYENAVFSYPLGESYLLSSIAGASSKQVRFALTTEQQLTQYNSQHASPEHRLVAVFPEEGTYWEDYRICLSDADWVTPAHHAALKTFVDFASSAPALKAAEELGFRIFQEEQEPVIGKFTEAPGGLPPVPVATLPSISGEVAAYLLEAWPQLRRPAAIVMVLDSSGSMEGDFLAAAKDQFRNVLARSSAPDLKALLSFGTHVELKANFSEKPMDAITALDTVQAIGGSSVYDALNKAYSMLSEDRLSSFRRSVLILTDGEDKNSEMSLGSLLASIHDRYEKFGINLVIVAIEREGASYADLERISQAANGVLKVTTPSELPSVFDDVARSL